MRWLAVVVLMMGAACGGPAGSAAGRSTSSSPSTTAPALASLSGHAFAASITEADRPPTPRLVGSYTLELRHDGAYVLRGPSFTARGRYAVEGGRITLRGDDHCEPSDDATYAWSIVDDRLHLIADATDPCDRPVGGRQFVLTATAWTRSQPLG